MSTMIDRIIRQIGEVFSDTSVPAETTLDRMITIRDAAQENIDTLKDDGVGD